MEREKIIEEIKNYMRENAEMGWVNQDKVLQKIEELLPEDAVVLTKEELVKTMESGYVYDTTSGDKINLIEMAREIERKETVGKIYKWLKYRVLDKEEEDFKKRFGVEVKE